MSDKSLSDQIADRMTATIERNMEAEMESLFGLTPQVPGGNLSLADLMKTAELLETPAQAWERDREACIKEDWDKGRGTLLINPEVEGAAKILGTITERDGVEYRVLIDECLRGTRNKDGSIRMGYWVDPLPPLDLTIPMVVEPELNDKWADYSPNRYFQSLSYPPINHTIQGLGVDVVDLGPTPMDLVSAELPRATVREQKRALVYCWKASQMGISLKEYARQCKWGRAWLERKRK